MGLVISRGCELGWLCQGQWNWETSRETAGSAWDLINLPMRTIEPLLHLRRGQCGTFQLMGRSSAHPLLKLYVSEKRGRLWPARSIVIFVYKDPHLSRTVHLKEDKTS